MSNKNILRRFVFIFVLFSISYCSFHDFTFKTVYDNAVLEAKKNIDIFKNSPDKDNPLGDETKKFK